MSNRYVSDAERAEWREHSVEVGQPTLDAMSRMDAAITALLEGIEQCEGHHGCGAYALAAQIREGEVTRKDYEAIAAALLEARRDLKAGLDPMEVLEVSLCGYMQQDNPRFDRERFLRVSRGEAKK